MCLPIHRTEVLSVSGALDEMPPYLDGHVQTITSAKDRVLREANRFRKGVREGFKKEKVTALGFAGGAFLGMTL